MHAHAEGTEENACAVVTPKKFLARVIVHHFRIAELVGWDKRVFSPYTGDLPRVTRVLFGCMYGEAEDGVPFGCEAGIRN